MYPVSFKHANTIVLLRGYILQVPGFSSTDDGFYEYHRITRVSNLLGPHNSTYLEFFQLADARGQQDKFQPSSVVYTLGQYGPDHKLEEQLVTLHKDSIAKYTTVEQCRDLLAASGFQEPGLGEFAKQVSFDLYHQPVETYRAIFT